MVLITDHFFLNEKPPDFSGFKIGFEAEHIFMSSSQERLEDTFLETYPVEEPVLSVKKPTDDQGMDEVDNDESTEESESESTMSLGKTKRKELFIKQEEKRPVAPIIYPPFMRACDKKVAEIFNKQIENLCEEKEALNKTVIGQRRQRRTVDKNCERKSTLRCGANVDFKPLKVKLQSHEMSKKSERVLRRPTGYPFCTSSIPENDLDSSFENVSHFSVS